jgi:predicted dehydrogenase
VAQPLRLGVVGVGALTLRGILPHLSQDDVKERVRIEALCDPVVTRAEAAAARYGVAGAFADVDEMLAEADIDAVTVASPIGLHHAHCRAALEAGKHVHANKTMTTTVREADELIALARSRHLCLVASPGEVLRPQIARTRELIESGAIGQLAWALCGGAFGEYHEDEPERRDRSGGAPIDPAWYFRGPGGGPLYDMTVYALHQLTSVLGPAQAVVGLSGIRVPERDFLGTRIPTEVDDNTILLLDFGDGLLAVAYGTAAGRHSRQFGAGLYLGTRGTIDGLLLNGEPFEFPGRELMAGAPPSDRMAQMHVLPHVVGAHRGIDESHVFEDIMQLVDWVVDGTATPVTAEHARHVIDIIESGYRAARTGVRQELTTTFEPSRAPAVQRRESASTSDDRR